MTQICFSNPGQLDLRALTVFGMNAKPGAGEAPIGYFGTGLKYAVACVLREGGTVVIVSGGARHFLFSEPTQFRGQDFAQVVLKNFDSGEETLLGFTTELGKNWQPWMALREFWSNCQDEQGQVRLFEEIEDSFEGSFTDGTTCIYISGDSLLQAWASRGEWLLQGEALDADVSVAIFPGPNKHLFYHGLRATHDRKDGKQWLFSYSIIAKTLLTEDRTFALDWDIRRLIAVALLKCTDASIQTRLWSEPGLEDDLDFDIGTAPSQEFINAGMERKREGFHLDYSRKEVLKKFGKKVWEESEALVVPASWDEMCKQEPRVGEAPETYRHHCRVDEHIEELKAQVTWWKACCRRLAGATGQAVDEIVTAVEAGAEVDVLF